MVVNAKTDLEIATLLSKLTVELETIMQSIKVRSHVGPAGIHDADLEVTVTVQPVTALKAKMPEKLGYPTDFFERTRINYHS